MLHCAILPSDGVASCTSSSNTGQTSRCGREMTACRQAAIHIPFGVDQTCQQAQLGMIRLQAMLMTALVLRVAAYRVPAA